MTEPNWEDIETLRTQVSAQCKLVASLAQSIADLHSQIGDMITSHPEDSKGVLWFQAASSRGLMENLADWLNHNDAVDDAMAEASIDVFEKAESLHKHMAETK